MARRTLSLLGLFGWFACCKASEADFNDIINKIQLDVLEFAQKVEEYYEKRCDVNTLKACSESNYHETLSSFPNQQCETTGYRDIAVCGESCGALYDFTTSAVRIPIGEVTDTKDYNPKDPRAVEAICFSSLMDKYLKEKKERDQSFWDRHGVHSPNAYFGSSSGAFRIYPGRTSNVSGSFDPRTRPWYVAASSGPKNVILILDTSRGIADFMDVLKDAANHTISSLTVGDTIAVVQYSSEARKIGREGKYVYQATKANQKILLEEIYKFEASGTTNTYDGFVKAFEILTDSYQQEYTVWCNTAILLLTDDRMPLTQTERYTDHEPG
jgi:von Willebrand factor type A domain